LGKHAKAICSADIIPGGRQSYHCNSSPYLTENTVRVHYELLMLYRETICTSLEKHAKTIYCADITPGGTQSYHCNSSPYLTENTVRVHYELLMLYREIICTSLEKHAQAICCADITPDGKQSYHRNSSLLFKNTYHHKCEESKTDSQWTAKLTTVKSEQRATSSTGIRTRT
jgi:hypothetical protein